MCCALLHCATIGIKWHSFIKGQQCSNLQVAIIAWNSHCCCCYYCCDDGVVDGVDGDDDRVSGMAVDDNHRVYLDDSGDGMVAPVAGAETDNHVVDAHPGISDMTTTKVEADHSDEEAAEDRQRQRTMMDDARNDDEAAAAHDRNGDHRRWDGDRGSRGDARRGEEVGQGIGGRVARSDFPSGNRDAQAICRSFYDQHSHGQGSYVQCNHDQSFYDQNNHDQSPFPCRMMTTMAALAIDQ